MKKLNLKVGIAAFSVLLIGLVTAALMTFNYADSENPLNIATELDAVYAEAATTGTTMIDRIIDNSYDGDDKDYHILEISSGSASTFSNFNNKFRDLVLDQHATNGKKYSADGVIEYTGKNVSNVTLKDIQNADLIYITEDPKKKFSNQNDIPSDLVSVLSNYAIGDYKPLIIDTTGGNGNISTEDKITYYTLYKNVLKSVRRYSFPYPSEAQAKDFLRSDVLSDLYLPIHGSSVSKNWEADKEGNNTVAKVLTITGDGSTGFANQIKGAETVKADDGTDLGYYDISTIKLAGSIKLADRMYVTGEAKPKGIKFESKNYNDVISEADLAKYDLVIIDDSCKGLVIDQTTYVAIRSFEKASGHIVYDKQLGDGAGSSSSGNVSNDIDTTANNYKTILSKVSQAGKPSYANVYVTDRGKFGTLLTNMIPDAYDDNIVYIINNGSFRGSGGTSDTSNKFTLLEIEPAYPLDTILESKFGAAGFDSTVKTVFDGKSDAYVDVTKKLYYLNTLNVLNGVTTDEISFDGTTAYTDKIVYTPETYTVRIPTGNLVTKTREVLDPAGGTTQKYVKLPSGTQLHSGDKILYNGYDYIWFSNAENISGTHYGAYMTLTQDVNTNGFSGDFYRLETVPKTVQEEYTEPEYKEETATRMVASAPSLNLSANNNLINYYAWKWSKAKLAYVSGKSYDEVEVVHMSSAEFNASLDTLNDSYDVIYLGGDNSDIKPSTYWYKKVYNTLDERWVNSSAKLSSFTKYQQFFDAWPAYTLYNTIGDTYSIVDPKSYADNDGNNLSVGAMAVSSGNDISDARLADLKKFYATNRPIIVGKDLYDAVTFNMDQNIPVTLTKDNMDQYLDNKIDPNSNMYSFVNTLISEKKSNVVLNFDFDDIVKVDNSDNYYGKTITEYATVFRNTCTLEGGSVVDLNLGATSTSNSARRDYQNNIIADATVNNGANLTTGNDVFKAINTSAQRPKYVVVSCPGLYSEGKTIKTTLTFKVKSLVAATASVYIDDDGDGKCELKVGSDTTLKPGTVTTVTGQLAKDFSGPVYWKLVVSTDANNTSSVSGVSLVETGKKTPINILQIVPSDNNIYKLGNKASDTHIYLCQDCQMNLQILNGNRLADNSNGYNMANFRSDNFREYIYNQAHIGDDALNSSPNPGFTGTDLTPDIKEPAEEANYQFDNSAFLANHGGKQAANSYTYSQMGIHEHHFGFAAIQDSSPANQTYYMEDFNLNLFDNAANSYDIRLTLLSIDDYNKFAAKINTIKEDNPGDFAKLSAKYYNYFIALSDILDEPETYDSTKYDSVINEILNINELSRFKTSLVNGKNIYDSTLTLHKGIDNLSNDGNLTNYFKNAQPGPNLADSKEIVTNISKHKTYNDIYFYNTGAQNGVSVGEYPCGTHNINYYFRIWRDAKVLEQYFYQKYIYYSALDAGGLRHTVSDDTTDNGPFGLVVLGAAEQFGKPGDEISQVGTDLLIKYATADSSLSSTDKASPLMLFHNVLNWKNGQTYFSKKMRPIVGMDTSDEFIRNSSRITKIGGKNVDLKPIELTDYGGINKPNSNEGAFVHKYEAIMFTRNSGTALDGVDTSNPNFDAQNFYDGGRSGDVGTDYAQCSATTKGIMTSYPNAISNKIKISGTHQQPYSLNIPKGLSVWYSLAGGTNGTDSSTFVADLNDHANNYYLYTYGNITYFGAGHMFHTGRNRLNSEESKLIINAVLNAARPSAAPDGPQLELVTHNDPKKPYPLRSVPEDSPYYKAYQYETTYYPDNDVPFKFGIQATSSVGIRYVDIWFDLDYDPNVNNGEHMFIPGSDLYRIVYGCPMNAQGLRGPDSNGHYRGDGWYKDASGNWQNFIKSDGTTMYIDEDAFNSLFSNLKLDDSFFPAKYAGDYTYLCVRIEDEKGKSVIKTIKIKRAPFLFDIT